MILACDYTAQIRAFATESDLGFVFEGGWRDKLREALEFHGWQRIKSVAHPFRYRGIVCQRYDVYEKHFQSQEEMQLELKTIEMIFHDPTLTNQYGDEIRIGPMQAYNEKQYGRY